MAEQVPAVCRMVHYVSYGSAGGEHPKACRAAIITEVSGDPAESVGLHVMTPNGTFTDRGIPRDDGRLGSLNPLLCGGSEYEGGTWHWPARS